MREIKFFVVHWLLFVTFYCLTVKGESTIFINKVWVDNLNKPIWGQPGNVQKCNGKKDCQEKLFKLSCLNLPKGHVKFINYNYTKVYCIKKVGYKQKLVDVSEE